MQEGAADRRGGGWLGFLPALAITLIGLGGSAVAYYAPPATGEMAVVFWPGTDQRLAYRTILDAGGRYVAGSRFGNIAIAYAPDPGFSERVRQAGALLLLAARGLCAPATDTGIPS